VSRGKSQSEFDMGVFVRSFRKAALLGSHTILFVFQSGGLHASALIMDAVVSVASEAEMRDSPFNLPCPTGLTGKGDKD
jgi:hypothetical protein